MAEDDDLVVVSDTDTEKKRQEFVNTEVSSLLITGFFIGMVVNLSMFGIAQQFVEILNSNESIRELVRKYWFQIDWWYWIIPLVISWGIFIYARHSGRKKLLKANRSFYGA